MDRRQRDKRRREERTRQLASCGILLYLVIFWTAVTWAFWPKDHGQGNARVNCAAPSSYAAPSRAPARCRR